MIIEINYFRPKSKIEFQTEVCTTETLEAENIEEIYKQFYEKNNSKRYCYGRKYEFKNPYDTVNYNIWYDSLTEHEKFKMYYGNSIVD